MNAIEIIRKRLEAAASKDYRTNNINNMGGPKMKTNTLHRILSLTVILAFLAGCGSSNGGGGGYGVIPFSVDTQTVVAPEGDDSNDFTGVAEPAPEPKQWSSVEVFNSGIGEMAHEQHVAADDSGNAVVVWLENVDGTDAVMSNRFAAGFGWQGITRLDTPGGGSAAGLSIAAGCNGHAVAVWHKLSGSGSTTYAEVLSPGEGWGEEIILSSGGFNPSVSMDSVGNAIVIWQNRNGATYDILAAHYSITTGWSEIALLENNSGTAANASVAFLSSGDAVAVWQQYINWNYSIVASQYDAAAGQWAEPVLLESDDYGRAMYPVLSASKTNDKAMVAWNHDIGTNDTVMASIYDPAYGWSDPYDVATGETGDSYDADLSFDSNGNAIVVWYNYDGSRGDSIMSAYFDAASGWGAPGVIVSGGDYEYLYYPKVRFTPAGMALAVWNRYEGEHTGVMMAWFDAANGWSTPETVGLPFCECGEIHEAYEPELVSDCAGNVTLTWITECYNCECRSRVNVQRYE